MAVTETQVWTLASAELDPQGSIVLTLRSPAQQPLERVVIPYAMTQLLRTAALLPLDFGIEITPQREFGPPADRTVRRAVRTMLGTIALYWTTNGEDEHRILIDERGASSLMRALMAVRPA